MKKGLKMPNKSRKKYTYAVGRRRSASARVRLYRGKEKSMVNNIPIEKYFPYALDKKVWNEPFEVTGTEGKYYVTVKVVGGGKKGQLGAVTHGISRALNAYNEEKFRPPLKKAGLLTRDPRIRERRKAGKGGKARRKKQSPKR